MQNSTVIWKSFFASSLWMKCPKQLVPVCKVWSVVGFELLVMKVMMWSTSIQSKRNKSVCGPGQVIPTVVLHWQPHVQDMKEHLCEWVAAQQHGVHRCEEPKWECLPSPRVLCSEGEGGRVLMVHLVKRAVKPRHLVMQHMPDEVLEIKEQQTAHQVPDDFEETGSLCWVDDRSPVPVQHAEREDVHHVIVERECQTSPHHPQGHWFLLDFISPH